jgi:FKBP-type peptidyl-prolyl cis-trans isomerase 2|tara:strand:- start:626 stop:1192 length:567 start_codon:yes stop_codon:yes gene_type:complete
MKVENGHNVQVHYKGSLSDGTEFDNSRARGKTLNFKVGSGRMISGFNDAVVGMKAGETKSFTLAPEQAYGPHDPKAKQVVPKEAFGPDFEFIIGGTIQGNGPTGPFLAKIQEVVDNEVTLDMNHPLAGKELNFDIELVAVEANSPTFSVGGWNKSMKKAELLKLAKQHGLPVNTRSTKTQIIEALQTA